MIRPAAPRRPSTPSPGRASSPPRWWSPTTRRCGASTITIPDPDPSKSAASASRSCSSSRVSSSPGPIGPGPPGAPGPGALTENSVAWSLSDEAIFYFLFPFLIAARALLASALPDRGVPAQHGGGPRGEARLAPADRSAGRRGGGGVELVMRLIHSAGVQGDRTWDFLASLAVGVVSVGIAGAVHRWYERPIERRLRTALDRRDASRRAPPDPRGRRPDSAELDGAHTPPTFPRPTWWAASTCPGIYPLGYAVGKAVDRDDSTQGFP